MKKDLFNNKFVFALIVLVLIAFFTMNSEYSFIGGAYSSQDVRIESVSPVLTNKVLVPGQTLEVLIRLKNYGLEPATYKVEHRLVADKNFPQYLAVVEPALNAVDGETDSVVTKMISGHEPGETIDVVMRAPVPTEESVIAGSTNNWDDEYVQIVGVYENPGAYMNNEYVVYTGVKINNDYLGQEFTDVCTKLTDCSGWLLGASECVNGFCQEKELNLTGMSDSSKDFSFNDFYNDNKVLSWAIIIILGFALIMLALGPKK